MRRRAGGAAEEHVLDAVVVAASVAEPLAEVGILRGPRGRLTGLWSRRPTTSGGCRRLEEGRLRRGVCGRRDGVRR